VLVELVKGKEVELTCVAGCFLLYSCLCSCSVSSPPPTTKGELNRLEGAPTGNWDPAGPKGSFNGSFSLDDPMGSSIASRRSLTDLRIQRRRILEAYRALESDFTHLKVADLFSAIREAIIKTSEQDTGGSTSVLFASKTKHGSGTSNRGPPPGPCPACKQIPLLADCKHPDKEKKQVKIAAAKKARKDAAKKAKEKEGASAQLADVKSDSAASTLTTSTKRRSQQQHCQHRRLRLHARSKRPRRS
jgi:hypothetical protein